LTEYFTRQFDLLRELDYETCPGEFRCAESETGVIFDIRSQNPEAPIDQICAQCAFLPTKPGQEPPHLTIAIQRANELDLDKRAGGVFIYPDSLSPFEWVCIEAIQTGRDASEMETTRRRRHEAERKAEVAQLEALRRR
jgi:hypothetical protein